MLGWVVFWMLLGFLYLVKFTSVCGTLTKLAGFDKFDSFGSSVTYLLLGWLACFDVPWLVLLVLLVLLV